MLRSRPTLAVLALAVTTGSACSALTGFGDLTFGSEGSDARPREEGGRDRDGASEGDAALDDGGASDGASRDSGAPTDAAVDSAIPMDGGLDARVPSDLGPLEDAGPPPRDTSMLVCSSALDCDDFNPCTEDSCTDGGCVTRSVGDGTTCGAADACSTAATCLAGVCTPGMTLACFDAGPCIQETCDPVVGCGVPLPAGAACDDGDDCSAVSMCDGDGNCVATAGCLADMDPCTVEACIMGTCATMPAANGTTCAGGQCCGGVCVNTSSSNTHCGRCGNACPGTTSCLSGICAACDDREDCDDGRMCTTDACESGRCVHRVDSGCFIDGVCFAVNEHNPSNDCERCAANGQTTWVPRMNGASCEDGIACTVSDTCSAGICQSGDDPCAGATLNCRPLYCDEAAGGLCRVEVGDPCPGTLVCCAELCSTPAVCGGG
ncbi:MAG: hypothetical protein IT379_37500 [Deltaproteobacteria bacterium]|nr:hypothetical protein [Deltaproteobacteria bacterium]